MKDFTPKVNADTVEARDYILLRAAAGWNRAIFAAAAMIGATINWIALWRADLILSHYDAKAHLVVARRIIDNTPGWQQIGGVWLPLPHLLNALPAQIDALYRTVGKFASLLSIACFGILVYAASRHVTLATGSRLAACVSAALLILNPNLLYLHATPMTEPLLLATTFLALLWLAEWVVENRDDVPAPLGMALFAAAWTRYEAWPVIAVALPVSLRVLPKRRVMGYGCWPSVATRALAGRGGFPVPADQPHHHRDVVRRQRVLRVGRELRRTAREKPAGGLVGHPPAWHTRIRAGGVGRSGTSDGQPRPPERTRRF